MRDEMKKYEPVALGPGFEYQRGHLANGRVCWDVWHNNKHVETFYRRKDAIAHIHNLIADLPAQRA